MWKFTDVSKEYAVSVRFSYILLLCGRVTVLFLPKCPGISTKLHDVSSLHTVSEAFILAFTTSIPALRLKKEYSHTSSALMGLRGLL